jgi:hypothetical protein
MGMTDEDHVERGRFGARQRGGDAKTRIDEDAEAIGLDDVAAAWTPMSGIPATPADHREPHDRRIGRGSPPEALF